MDLFLVRHGPAGHYDPSRWQNDADRPLEDVGRTKAAASGLVRLVPTVDAVLSSAFVRAWQTAALLHEAGWPEPERLRELEAGTPPGAVADLLQARTEQSVALVGHEPQLSRLASILCGGGTFELKKGGAIAIADGTLRWSLPPRVLRLLA